jgi:CubicO group peptidase (beta-lactamase class C family)
MQSRPAATLLMTIALCATSGSVAAQEGAPHSDPRPQLTPDRVYALDASMERVVQDFAIPGLAIGIVEDGRPVYVRAFGVRDTKTAEPVDTHTLFHVAAITRTFTATAIMQLVERGQVALADASASSPTQLLMHDGAEFDALGALIETASKQDFSLYMKSQVLDAAGLVESTFDAPRSDVNLAWPHTGKMFVRRAPRYPWHEASLPSGGLSASIADLTHWAALQVSRDPVLLAPASYQAMFEHRGDSKHLGIGTALGWQLERRGDQWLPRQAAVGRGFSALLTLYPAQRRAIVILSNGERTPGKEIRAVIESVLAGESWVPPKPSLLLRSDFQWIFGALLGMTLLLISMSVHYRRHRGPN